LKRRIKDLLRLGILATIAVQLLDPQNMKLLSRISLILFVTGCIGCASAGRPIAQQNVSKIKTGVTTEADLVRMFGPPNSKSLTSDGKILMMWIYSESQVKGTTFIPIVGAFAGGVDSRTQTLSVLIGSNGKVVRYTTNDSPIEARSGLGARHAE
jgi:hypothetical protein